MSHKPTVFFIGDHHFGHSNIIKFEPIARPFNSIQEHDKELISRWNNIVRVDDIVFHLGDFSMSAKDIYIAGLLNGHKRLILGNHDKNDMSLYTPHFEKIYATTNYGGYLLSHMPVHPNSLGKYKGCIHGHLHSKKIERWQDMLLSKWSVVYGIVALAATSGGTYLFDLIIKTTIDNL